jgi:hypothetical protein
MANNAQYSWKDIQDAKRQGAEEMRTVCMWAMRDFDGSYLLLREVSIDAEPPAVPAPTNSKSIWPTCKWCGADLERFVKDSGKCPKCGAMEFPTVPAPTHTPLKDRPTMSEFEKHLFEDAPTAEYGRSKSMDKRLKAQGAPTDSRKDG